MVNDLSSILTLTTSQNKAVVVVIVMILFCYSFFGLQITEIRVAKLKKTSLTIIFFLLLQPKQDVFSKLKIFFFLFAAEPKPDVFSKYSQPVNPSNKDDAYAQFMREMDQMMQ